MSGNPLSIIELLQLLGSGVLTINEVRAQLGFEPFGPGDLIKGNFRED